jgi:hypothetical protein
MIIASPNPFGADRIRLIAIEMKGAFGNEGALPLFAHCLKPCHASRGSGEDLFKLQSPSSREAPSIKHQVRDGVGAWNLKFPWCLDVGAWSFPPLLRALRQPRDDSKMRAPVSGSCGGGAKTCGRCSPGCACAARRRFHSRTLLRLATRCETVSSVSSPMLERRKVSPLILP